MAFLESLDLVVIVVSAKHLKNVNWRNGDLKPYAVLCLDQDHYRSTRSDDSGSTKPAWNERITLRLTRPIHESVLTVEIFHWNSSDLVKSLVGSVRFPLAHLTDSDDSMLPESFHSLELLRPSGRPQGRIRMKLAIKERPSLPPHPQSQMQDYYSAPQVGYYYSSAPPPPPPPPPLLPPASPLRRDYREFSPYTDQHYSGFYCPPPPPLPPPPLLLYDRPRSYSLPGGPSAPSYAFSSNDHKPLTPPPPLAPRLSNYMPPPIGQLTSVDASPLNDPKPQPPSLTPSSRLSNSGVPSGPSVPVDYSPYDHRQLQWGMRGLSLGEES